VEITMNNRQNITTFDTRYSGQCPWKNPEGKTNQGEILLIELCQRPKKIILDFCLEICARFHLYGLKYMTSLATKTLLDFFAKLQYQQ
jgi:hypothetical protein